MFLLGFSSTSPAPSTCKTATFLACCATSCLLSKRFPTQFWQLSVCQALPSSCRSQPPLKWVLISLVARPRKRCGNFSVRQGSTFYRGLGAERLQNPDARILLDFFLFHFLLHGLELRRWSHGKKFPSPGPAATGRSGGRALAVVTS